MNGRTITLLPVPILWLAAAGFLPGSATAATPSGRTVASLDGEWLFRLDPECAGGDAKWFSADVPFKDAIKVPGAWQAQGYGSDTDKLHHSYDGKAWYRREVPIPSDWAGKRVFLCIGGVHRYAEVWVNGARLGEHIGYLSPFEYEITRHARPGTNATIAVCVDSRQRWDIDCLTGCFDIIDEMFTQWGGIWGHVTLEARNAAWLTDLFVQTKAAPALCTVTAALAGDKTSADAVTLQILAKDGRVAASSRLGFDRAKDTDAALKIAIEIPDAQLWSPDMPYLYTARLSLMKGSTTVDQIETRFGVREIEIRGNACFLNGKKVFLHGYGDDSVYPQTMAAPSDRQFYLQRLKVAKEYGFNYVRHHSTILPPEYYDATDEAGMFVSAEFPIAYMQYYQKAKGPAVELYKSEWSAAIARLRNHPSIFNWCMGNELWEGTPLGPDLYAMARRLDPTRPVIDSDGVWPQPYLSGKGDRATLDFCQVQFDEPGVLPIDSAKKYEWSGVPRKPILSHETGNYATFPRMSQIGEFKDNFKPFWLTPARTKLEKLGLLGEAEQWSRNSERLYLLAHKLNTEAIRKNPMMSGYTWWLLQDYWTGSNGIVDTYFRRKDIDAETVRQFNADVVLLLDGLEPICRAPCRMRPKLIVSNYSPQAIEKGDVTWKASCGSDGGGIIPDVAQGEVKTVIDLNIDIAETREPSRLTIAAEMKVGAAVYRNKWSMWVYPADVEKPKTKVALFAGGDLLHVMTALGAKTVPEGKLPASAVYVVTQPNADLLDAVEAGACLVCLSPQGIFPSVRNRFKPAWWIGNDLDCNTGTVVYDNPVTRAMAPDGWCDIGWYRLLEDADAYVLDGFPARPHVLVRGLDVHFRCRSKALLFEARVGKGSLIVSGLNHLTTESADVPEAQWLLSRLVEYACALPKPAAELPVAFVRKQAARAPAPVGPMLAGFARLTLNQGETTTNRSYREAEAPIYVCRQTEPGHAIEWRTAVIPTDFTGKTATFVFAGALGWKSEPRTDGLVLLLNGEELVHFDLAQEYAIWRSTDGKAALCFVPRSGTGEDVLGLFYLTVPADRLARGESCRLTVRSEGKGSRRWFGLTPYTDIIAPPPNSK